MYRDHFGLKETPFAITPDPRFLFMSEPHREALAHLLYGMKSDGGFVLLTGEVGTGKTTVCRCLLEQLPADSEVAFILNPKLTAGELLATICDEFAIEYPAGNTSLKVFVDRIAAYLLSVNARGRRAILIIDEAQNLHPEVLEQIRLLTNLETSSRKLLQIIMLGQPELRQMLARPELRQLAQRITARYHLGPIPRRALADYLAHRLAVAGVRRQVFPTAVLGMVYHFSGGIPRLINILCDRALLGAYVQGLNRVDRKTLRRAAGEVFGFREGQGALQMARKWLVILLVLVAGGSALCFTPRLLPRAHVPDPTLGRQVMPRASSPPEAKTKETGPSWLATTDTVTDPATAYATLFRQWGVSYNVHTDGNACSYARAHGLSCLHKRGSLGALRQFDRPAVLSLVDGAGKEHYFTLTTLGTDSATLLADEKVYHISLPRLEKGWRGEFSLLWRRPAHFRRVLFPGAQGPEVRWLAGELAQLQHWKPTATDKVTLTGALLQRLKQFQMAVGLVPDGICGEQTIIQLNTARRLDVPRLSTTREAR